MNIKPAHNVAIIAYNNISLFHLSIPCSIFGEDLDRTDARPYNVEVCTEHVGLVDTLSGFPITINKDLSIIANADTVIVPAWCDPDTVVPAALLNAINNAHARGARIVGLCLGAFVLAEAGILEGKTASTHWVWADEFAKKYPNVNFDNDVLYINVDNVFTSAGSAAAIDCCLHILRLDHGADIANRVARRMVVAPHRSGGQVQYIEKPLPRNIDSNRLEPAISWAINNVTQPLNIDLLANKASMSRRNFSRLFKKTMGLTFTQWLLEQRLTIAQQQLETTSHTIDRVATDSGFSSSVSFRQHFLATFSISPTAYRKQFKSSESK